MKHSRLALLAILIAIPLQDALAADWQLVLSDRNRRVEIDRASIFSSDRGTKVSWGRVVLAREEATTAGYATIKALNRYDCQNRTFATIKRVYLDSSDHLVREESEPDQTPLRVTPNSVDERMWREVCSPPSAADLEKVASEVQKLAAALQPPASAAPTPGKTVAPQKPALPPVVARAPGPEAPVASKPAAEPARAKPIDARDTSVRPVRTAEPASVPVAASAKQAEPAMAGGDTPKASIVPLLPNIRPPKPDPEVRESDKAKPTPPEPVRKVERPASAPASKAEPPGRPAAREVDAPRPLPPVAMARPQRPKPPAPARASQPVMQSDALDALLAQQRSPQGLGWSYEGETGPEAWGRLRPDWRICREGTRQSPIDLRDGLAVDLAPVKFHYRSTGFRIRDTGNTLQVDVGEGMGMEVRGVRYELERFTLHRPSQERIGGMAYDMTMYLEHRSADGKVAILSILLAAGETANPLLQTLWNNLPLDRGREFVPDAIIDLAAFMPTDPAHFLYMGSLPVPPCTEDVVWVVMKSPVLMSQDQLAVFARLYPRNTRPIQPTNGRLILESR